MESWLKMFPPEVLRYVRKPLPSDWKENDITFMTTFTEFAAEGTAGVGASTVCFTGVTMDQHTVGVNIKEFYPYMFVAIHAPTEIAPDCSDEWAEQLTPAQEQRVKGLRAMLNNAISARGKSGGKERVRSVEFVMKTNVIRYRTHKSLFVKIVAESPNDIPTIREVASSGDVFGPSNIEVFECNVPFILRMMVDRDIPGMGWMTLPRGKFREVATRSLYTQIEVEIDAEDIVARPDITEFAPMRVMYWDTEQYAEKGFPQTREPSHEMILHGIVMYETDQFCKGREVLRVAAGVREYAPIEGVKTIWVESERKLYYIFLGLMHIFDPDVLGGYNSINHDMRWYIKRAAVIGMKMTSAKAGFPDVRSLCRRREHICRIKMEEIESGALGKQTYSYAPMLRNQTDIGIPVRRDVGMPLRNYTLDFVAGKVVGEHKNPVSYQDIPRLHNGTPEDRAVLGKYCVQDASLCGLINEKMMYLSNYSEIARECRVPFVYMYIRGQGPRIQALLLRRMRQHRLDYVMPYHAAPMQKKKRSNEEKDYEGAVVLDPAIGFYTLEDDGAVTTLDFASMYPHIMVAYNVCYTTYVPPEMVEEVRASGIPVRQAPSPKSKKPEGSDEYIPGHHFVYPWRDCTEEEAKEHKEAGKNVRRISELSYIRRHSIGANNDIPAVGQWQWEDPSLVGLLPDILLDLLARRKVAKRDMGKANDRSKYLNHTIGLSDVLAGDMSGLKFLMKPNQIEKLVQKGEETVLHALSEDFVGVEITKKRIAVGDTTRKILEEYLELITTKFREAFGDEGTVALTEHNIQWFFENIKNWDDNASANNGRQMALKVLCNSVYGFTGATVGKLPMIEVSSTVTAYGRDMIYFTKEVAEMRDEESGTYGCVGCPYRTDTLYGDTDSVMVMLDKCHDIREANEYGRKMAKFISGLFQHPKISLEWEKTFFMFLLMQKKRYIAYQIGELNNGDLVRVLNCKGVEITRRDNPECTRNQLLDIIEDIFLRRDIPGAVRRVKEFLRRIMFDDFEIEDYAESRFVNKRAEDYTNPPAFIKLVEKEEKRKPGQRITGRFQFVHISRPQPKNKKDTKKKKLLDLETPEFVHANPSVCVINREHYIEKLRPIVGRIFANILIRDGTGNKHYPTYELATAAYEARKKKAETLLFSGEHMNKMKASVVASDFFGRTTRLTPEFDPLHKEVKDGAWAPDDAGAFFQFSRVPDASSQHGSVPGYASKEYRETPEGAYWFTYFEEHGMLPEGANVLAIPGQTPSDYVRVTREYEENCVFASFAEGELPVEMNFTRLEETRAMWCQGKRIFGPRPSLLTIHPVPEYTGVEKEMKQPSIDFSNTPCEVEITGDDDDEEEEYDFGAF